MKTGSTRKLLVVTLFVVAGAALAACSGIPPSAAALMDREAIDALAGTNIQISTSSDLSVGGEIEFTGGVEAIAGADWRIGGVSVLVAAGTEVNGSPAVGDTVKVHGLLQGDGSVLAFEIEAAAAGSSSDVGETEFTGTVELIAGDVWTIGGQAVLVDGSTEIKGSPAVGDEVKVHGLMQSDGSLLAREIEKAGEDDSENDQNDDSQDEYSDGSKQEITGTLEAMDGDIWTIDGVQVLVSGSTEVKGDPQVGDTVKVEGMLLEDGSIQAHEIEVEDDSIGEDDGTDNSQDEDEPEDHSGEDSSDYGDTED